MKPVAVSREIAAPLEKVFQTVSDIRNYSQAVPAIIRFEFLSEVEHGVGCRFRETREMNGREVSTVLEVTGFETDDHIRYVSDAGGTIWDSVFTVQPAPGSSQTLLSLHMEVRPYRLGARIFNFFIRGMVVKGVAADLDAVKAHCEAKV